MPTVMIIVILLKVELISSKALLAKFKIEIRLKCHQLKIAMLLLSKLTKFWCFCILEQCKAQAQGWIASCDGATFVKRGILQYITLFISLELDMNFSNNLFGPDHLLSL